MDLRGRGDSMARDWWAAQPDDPVHLEARGLVARGAQLVCSGEASAVLSPLHDLAVLLGAPDEGVAAAVEAAEVRELHVPGDGALRDAWAQALGATVEASAEVSACAALDGAALESLMAHEVAPVEGADDPLLETLPRDTVHEFTSIDPLPRAFVALAGGEATALAYAFVESDRWIDVSIETVPAFRRSGFGTSAVAALMADAGVRGLGSVWVAAVTNGPSLALARKLGFGAVGQLGVLTID